MKSYRINSWNTLKKVFFTLCLCASTLSAFAQGGTVTGVVTDETGATMPGVNVMVRGTTIGVVTDADGKFSINAASTDVLQVSFVGYTTQEITVGEQTSVNVSLAEGAQQIDEVVVTALGIKRDKKALGYATQEISADKLLETRTSSVANALIGKVAGAQITESGMGMGGSTRIVIRGASSLSGQNQPLWVVDGIPIDDSQPVDVVMENDWSARDRAGMASQINPDDIESISILKGPSASALYGIRAGSGVVLVTTKKGAAGKWTVNWNSNYTVEKIASLPNLQNKYGQGTGGIYDVQSELSWGPEMTGQKLLNFRGQSVDFLPQSNREKDFFKTGSGFTNTVSVSGGNDVASVRLSFNDSRNKGVMPEHSLNRQGVDLHGSVKLGKRLVISGKANYIAENVQNPLETGQYSPMNQLMLMPRSVRLQDLTPSREAGKHVNWKPDDSFHINPMFSPEWNNYSNKTSRLLGYVSADLEITRTLSLSAKSGLDYYGLDEASKEYPWEAKGSRVYAVREGYVQENNSDILLKFNNRYGKFDIGLNVGASYMHRKLDNVKVTAPFQNGDSFFSVGNGSSLTVAEQLSERSTNSVYGMANFAYNDYLYLDFTARNDWASTLPKNSWSFFYPSVSVGYVFSEMMNKVNAPLPAWISFLKLRGSWAQVGHDTDPYKLAAVYTVNPRGVNGIPYADPPKELPLANLKPEMTTSVEVGADIRFFYNRLGIDVTYYDAKTKNQILSVDVGAVSGAEKRTINAGEVENKGIEVMLNAVPIQSKDFVWNIGVNYARNRNKVNELVEGLPFWQLGNSNMVSLRAIPGQPFGDLYSRTLKRNSAGQLLVSNTGSPIIDNDYTRVGNINPNWLGSITNSFSYKGFTLNVLIDGHFGGDVISMTEAVTNATGNGKRTENREDMLLEGVTEAGATNTSRISAQSYWTAVAGGWGRSGVADEFLYDATFVKLRELSLSYRLPQKWIAPLRISQASIALQSRNLFYFLRHTPGTNPEGTSGRGDKVQGWELSTIPETRTFGVNLNLTF